MDKLYACHIVKGPGEHMWGKSAKLTTIC